jgi:hypothetical protein
MAQRYEERGQYAVSIPIQKHLEACGIATTGERNGAGIRRYVAAGFHSLRHSAVTLMREAGAAQSISQAIVGHNSPEIHALYTHADEAALRRAVTSLPAVMQDTPAPALPPAKLIDAAKVRELAQGMTATTWHKAQAELLALAG